MEIEDVIKEIEKNPLYQKKLKKMKETLDKQVEMGAIKYYTIEPEPVYVNMFKEVLEMEDQFLLAQLLCFPKIVFRTDKS